MRTRSLILMIIAAACLTACSVSVSETPFDLDPATADREIDAALKFIDKAPESAAGYNQLAVIYIKRARETGDFSLNEKAESAVGKALKVAPDDVSALKLQASLHLTFHRFGEGLEAGNRLVKDHPDDAFVYGVLTDANAEMGNYPEAVAAAQRMVDLKPNSSSYARVAHLRSLHGDHLGAVEMYKLAARTADPQDNEAQSWCLTQLGTELWRNGKYTESENVFDEALRVLPGYHLALAGKGRSLASRGEFQTAAKVLIEAQARFANTETAILLGDVYARQEFPDKAREQYELAQADGEGHDAHRVALYWADHDINLDEAVKVAREDYAQIKDIYAADILSWCLYKKGYFSEAKAMITEAMRLKTRDARIYYHAGMIEMALSNKLAARQLLETALSLNPGFDVVQSANARKAVESLK